MIRFILGGYRFFRAREGGFNSGGATPPGIYDFTPVKVKGLRYTRAPHKRPLHKTRFR